MERLKEERVSALAETDNEIKKWEVFKKDYNSLRTKLLTLPDTLSQDVMVPFGTKAFMRGRLIHTNEILVLLGDNWFAERSAKQAAEIVSHRLDAVEESLKKLNQQRKLLSDRLDLTSELFGHVEGSDFFEIKEEYDAETEKLWKARHRNNVRDYRRKMKAQSAERDAAGAEGASDKASTDRRLWERLDELEATEKDNDELNRVTDDNLEVMPQTDEDAAKRVRWVDEGGSDSNTSDEGEGRCITFSHTPAPNGDSTQTSTPPVGPITSPAQLYTHFYHPTPILKPSGAGSASSDYTDPSPPTLSPVDTSKAFPGTVTEHGESLRRMQDIATSSIPDASGTSSAIEPTAKPRKMSKFKQERQQRLGSR